MKLSACSDSKHDRHVSWITALWATLAMLAAGAVLLDTYSPAPQTAVAAVTAPAQIDGITPSDPALPAASDQLAPTP